VPAASARGQVARPPSRRSAARHGRRTACSVNRTLATGGAAGEWCNARAGQGPRADKDKGNILGRSGWHAGGAGHPREGRARARGPRQMASASLLMLRAISRGESQNGGCDLKMTTLGNEVYVQSNISKFVMT